MHPAVRERNHMNTTVADVESAPAAAADGGPSGRRKTGGRHLARAALACAVIALAAACNSAPSSSGGAGTAMTPGGGATSSVASVTSSAPAAGFVGIVEPWDPGHPARTAPAPANCYNQPSTVDIVQCFEVKIENIDAEIDGVQQARYAAAAPSGKIAILAQDRAWLNARSPVCSVAFHTGGSVDQISAAACVLAESTARLWAVKGLTPPVAMLKSTDVADPDVFSWYTTPEGSRIAMLSTQGDQTATGGIIEWFIIGGADGFIINPRQFYFTDGSFTDHGTIVGPNPTWHRVGTGVEYTFSIDYSHLDQAPTGNPAEGFAYVPGTPVAIWH